LRGVLVSENPSKACVSPSAIWLSADVPGWSEPSQLSAPADLARKLDRQKTSALRNTCFVL
jgi:hypothetical protein